MARILGYIAASLDGFIADPQEGLDWLYKAEASSSYRPESLWLCGRKCRGPRAPAGDVPLHSLRCAF